MNAAIESEHFIETSRHFCAWIEGPAMHPSYGVKTSVKLLSKLYQEGLILPTTDIDDLIAPINVNETLLERMSERFQEFPFAHYHIAEPTSPEIETKKHKINEHKIAESFALIYQSIKNGLDLLDNDNIDEAIHYWRVGFKLQWGKTITCIILVMHEYLSKEKLL